MTLHDARTHAAQALAQLPYYAPPEAAAIAKHLLAELLQLKPHELILHRDRALEPAQEARFAHYLARLLEGEPLQYIVGHAPFLGLLLEVNRHTLIPRPETEELVAWITASHTRVARILDVGTGTGCIALSLKEAYPAAEVLGIDIDPLAVRTAERNARRVGLLAHFTTQNALTAPPEAYTGLDLLVANPPYVPTWERHSLNPNVEAWEPPTALFVPDDDPLLHYRNLAHKGHTWLRPGGWLYVEAHTRYAEAVAQLFTDAFYRFAEVRTDLQGRPRHVRAQLPD